MSREELERQLSKLPHKIQVRFALACARDVQHLVEVKDKEVIEKCLNIVELWLIDKASKQDALEASYVAYAVASFATSFATSFAASAASNSSAYAAYAASAASNSSAYYASAASAASNSSAYYASAASKKGLDYYHRILVDILKDLTEIERIIYDMEAS